MLTLYFDDTCILCTTNAEVVTAKNPQQIRAISVNQGLAELEHAGISRLQAMTYVCVKNQTNNQIMMGMQAIRLLFKTAGFKYYWVLHLPIVKQVTELSYPLLARNRYRFPKWLIRLLYGKVATLTINTCPNNQCQLPPEKRV